MKRLAFFITSVAALAPIHAYMGQAHAGPAGAKAGLYQSLVPVPNVPFQLAANTCGYGIGNLDNCKDIDIEYWILGAPWAVSDSGAGNLRSRCGSLGFLEQGRLDSMSGNPRILFQRPLRCNWLN